LLLVIFDMARYRTSALINICRHYVTIGLLCQYRESDVSENYFSKVQQFY
jgi:hypothetical protein